MTLCVFCQPSGVKFANILRPWPHSDFLKIPDGANGCRMNDNGCDFLPKMPQILFFRIDMSCTFDTDNEFHLRARTLMLLRWLPNLALVLRI